MPAEYPQLVDAMLTSGRYVLRRSDNDIEERDGTIYVGLGIAV